MFIERQLMACHDCDAAQIEPRLEAGSSARCWRCGSTLARAARTSIEGAVALAAASMVLFIVAHSFPVAKVLLQAKPHEPTFIGSIGVVLEGGHVMLAGIIFITLVLIPLVQISLSLYLLVPVWLGRVPSQVGPAYRLFHGLRPWSQLDILWLGIFVALGKMSRYAEITGGIPIPALAAAIVLTIVVAGTLEGPLFWEHVATNRRRARALDEAPALTSPERS